MAPYEVSQKSPPSVENAVDKPSVLTVAFLIALVVLVGVGGLPYLAWDQAQQQHVKLASVAPHEK